MGPATVIKKCREAQAVPASAPRSRRLLLPQPDDPIHILRLTAKILEPRHTLPTVMLRVHGHLHKRFGNCDDARRIRKPWYSHCSRKIVGFHVRREFTKSSVGVHCAFLDIVKRRRSAGRGSSRILSTQDRQEPVLDSDDMADPPSHLLKVPAGRIAPRLEENGIGPFSVCHEIT
jgi:hypothetical protein